MKRARIAVLALAGLGVAACATTPDYRPSSSPNGVGYSEQIIESDRYLVTFRGSTSSPRDKVESSLLLRAAEVTLNAGYDYFTVIEKESDTKSRFYPSSFGPSRYGFGYSFYHPRVGWRYSYDPFWNAPTYSEATQYEISAEIRLGLGEKPEDADRAFDAREVVRNVGPTIERPVN